MRSFFVAAPLAVTFAFFSSGDFIVHRADARMEIFSTPEMTEFQKTFSRGCAAVKEDCLVLMGDAIAALKLNAPVCEQQDVADRMIDLAKGHIFRGGELIKAAKLYRALEKETPAVLVNGELLDQDSLYCMRPPRSRQLLMINQGQSAESNAKYYHDPETNRSLEFLAEGTIPRRGSTPGAWIQRSSKLERAHDNDKLHTISGALGIKGKLRSMFGMNNAEKQTLPQAGIQAF